jgi:hypothetical protein
VFDESIVRFSQIMKNSVDGILLKLQQKDSRFSSNITANKEKLDILCHNFEQNVIKLKSNFVRREGKEIVLDRHKFSSCAVKAIIETKVFEFNETGIGDDKFPAALAFANEYWAYWFVIVVVDSYRKKAAKTKNKAKEVSPGYSFPVLYGNIPHLPGETDSKNLFYFDEIFCKLLRPYVKTPSAFPLYDFAVLFCTLNTTWNCFKHNEAREFYYQTKKGG